MLKGFFAMVFGLAGSLSAQTFYQPVEYQYRSGGTLYFYDGDDRRVHAIASEPAAPAAAWGRHGGYAFASATVAHGRTVETERVRIFSDAWRSGLQDAGIVGMTVADIRNQAYASVPRYFRKADLLSAVDRVDGVGVVPARTNVISVRKSSGATVLPEPKPFLIVPKSVVRRPPQRLAQASVD